MCNLGKSEHIWKKSMSKCLFQPHRYYKPWGKALKLCAYSTQSLWYTDVGSNDKKMVTVR